MEVDKEGVPIASSSEDSSTTKEMKTEAMVTVEAKLSKSWDLGCFRAVLKIDEGKEELTTMSGQKDFPAPFLAKLLLPGLPGGHCAFAALDQGAKLHLTRRLEIVETMDSPQPTAWNVTGMIQKVNENVQMSVKISNENCKEDPVTTKMLCRIEKVLPHQETIHEHLEERQDDQFFHGVRIMEGTGWIFFLMEDKSLVQGCLYTTWTYQVINPNAVNIRKEAVSALHEEGFSIDARTRTIKMFGESRYVEEEARGEKRGAEGDGDQVDGEDEGVQVGKTGQDWAF